MRDSRRTLLPSVLALTFVTLLVTPIAAAAASGLPASISMEPGSATPGETVVVTGLDFPVSQSVEVQLSTPAGLRYLSTITADADGYFSERVVLPADAEPGAWELRAASADGINASYAFGSFLTANDADLATSRGSSNSVGDIAVMLIMAFGIAGVIGAVGFVYYQVKMADGQPGMGAGSDPIWSGARSQDDPASSATDEPVWLNSSQEPLTAPNDTQA